MNYDINNYEIVITIISCM